MADTTVITQEEINNLLNAKIKELLTKTLSLGKNYADANLLTNKDVVKQFTEEAATELGKELITEATKEDLKKATNVADAFLKALDSNKDGTLDPKELASYLSEIKENTGKLSELSEISAKIQKSITDFVQEVAVKISKVEGKVEVFDNSINGLKTINPMDHTKQLFNRAQLKDIADFDIEPTIKEVANIFAV